MATASFVDRDIQDGRRLLEQLDRDRFPVSAAFWYHNTDTERWELVLETALVTSVGPSVAYLRLGESLRRARSIFRGDLILESSTVKLVKEDDRLPSLIRQAVPTGPEISEIRFASEAIKGVFLDDAVIYRTVGPAVEPVKR